MTNKKFIPRLLEEVKLRWPLPTAPRKGLSLLEQGGVAMLMRTHTQRQAETSIQALMAAYEDWNEVRVSQIQEIAVHIALPAAKKSATAEERQLAGARLLKDYLHEVFQKTHGLDLEFLREDLAGGAKIIAQMPILGLTTGSYLLWLANDEQVPVHLAMMRFLDRLGLIGRTTSVAKATVAIQPLVPAGKGLEFTTILHEALELWADPEHPIFEDVAVLRECPYGTKAYQERVALLARQEAQRKREDERRRQALKKESDARRKEEERVRKKAEGLAKRRAREVEKRRRIDGRKAKAEAKKAELAKAAKKKAADKLKADAAKKRAAGKAKSAGAKKKAAPSKGSSKKPAAKKKAASAKKAVAPKKKAATAKKKAAAARKKPAASKKKTTAKKASSSKKTTTKKPASKKASTSRTAKKKTTRSRGR